MYNINDINSNNTGIVICSGDGDIFLELIALLSQFKYNKWNQSFIIPIVITHCNELSDEKLNLLNQMKSFGNITTVNICSEHSINSKLVDHKKLKSFFCKPMSLLHSPFIHTIIVDTDVIWLDSPMNLLSSPSYIETGALFFRDRLTQTRNRLTLTAGSHTANDLFNYLENLVDKLNSISINNIRETNNKFALNKTGLALNNAFWRHFVYGKELTLDHLQDSSVVVMDSSRHKNTLLAIKLMLKDFHIGYGDKEIYWLAATASNEKFSFEPYLPGSFGDCGAILHYNPIVSTNNSLPKPLYINAEYLIDLKKINNIGDFIKINNDESMITLPKRMNELTTPIEVLRTWKNMEHGFYPCGNCQLFGCVKADSYIINEIKIRQQIILNLSKSKINNKINIDTIESIIIDSYK